MLARAIEEADWPRALVLAIEAWRESRAPVLADLVDRVAARLPSDEMPTERVQRWWMQQARTYDPLRATALLANAAELALKTGVEKKLIDRLPVLGAWPADPRVARVLASWFADANVGWRYSHEAETIVFYERLADHLARLRDVRAIPFLERVLAEPRGLTVGLRERQRELATQLIDLLADTALHAPPLANAGEIARWCPSPARLPMSLDERALWREAATSDDARLVLADYLLERGDRRGEIITLASAGTEDTTRQASALLHEHWERWMGDLALVLDRGNCSFAGGLLAVATVGIYSSPEWAYPKVARHRELSTVQIVRPGWNASIKGYVAFLDALEQLPPRIRIRATMIEPFALARPRWPVRHLELIAGEAVLERVLPLAASTLPDVEAIDFPLGNEIDREIIAAIATLPRHFAKLARVHVDASSWLAIELRDALAELEALPFVDVDHGSYRT